MSEITLNVTSNLKMSDVGKKKWAVRVLKERMKKVPEKKFDPEQILAEGDDDELPISEEPIDISVYPWADEDDFYE